jgi:hypothetical protein
MSKPYMINAWCDRPFITVLDVEAETPERGDLAEAARASAGAIAQALAA